MNAATDGVAEALDSLFHGLKQCFQESAALKEEQVQS